MPNIIEIEKGDVLFKEGENPDALYIIESGKVVITKKRGTVELELVVLEKGQVLGEMGFFDSKTRSATAKALTALKVIEIKYEQLKKLYDTYPDYFKAIISSIVERLRRTNNRVKLLEQNTATIDYTGKSEKHKLLNQAVMIKIVSIISFLCSKYGESSDNNYINFKYSFLNNYGSRIFEIPVSRITAALEALELAEYLRLEKQEDSISSVIVLNKTALDNYIKWANEEIYKSSSDKINLGVLSLEAMKVLSIYGHKGYKNSYKIKNPKDNNEWIDKEVWELNISPFRDELLKTHGVEIEKLSFKELIIYKIVDDVLAEDSNKVLVRYDKELLEFLYTSYKIQYYMSKVSVGQGSNDKTNEYR